MQEKRKENYSIHFIFKGWEKI